MTKKGKVIATRLDDDLMELFSMDVNKYGGEYKALREILRQYYREQKKPEEIKHFEQLEKTGDVIEDAKSLANSNISSMLIKQVIAEMDNQKKLKNSMKKAGAFHEENALTDLASMIKYGKPTFHELRYFFDFWYNMAICLNALSLRGNRLTKFQRQTMRDLERPLPNPNSKTTLETSVQRTRVSRKKV